jgi:hypothetical protein
MSLRLIGQELLGSALLETLQRLFFYLWFEFLDRTINQTTEVLAAQSSLHNTRKSNANTSNFNTFKHEKSYHASFMRVFRTRSCSY